MLLDILKQINWVDIFIAIILFRICFIAVKTSLPVEVFKFFGTFFSAYLSLHYYIWFADIIRAKLGVRPESWSIFTPFAFALLWAFGYVVFLSFRVLINRFIKLEAVSKLATWGAFVLGSIRGVLTVSLMAFMLLITSVNYFDTSVKDSLLGKFFVKIAPSAYTSLWDGFASKFMPDEKYNKAVPEALQKVSVQKQLKQ